MENEKPSSNARGRNFFLFSLIISLFVSHLVIVMQIIRWELVDILTPFIEPLLELLIVVGFFGVFCWSLLNFAVHITKSLHRALLPLAIQLITVLIVILVPFTKIVVTFDFIVNLKAREKVVEMVQSGQIEPYVSYNDDLMLLPKQYEHLSKGGRIIVDDGTSKIFFFTFTGVLDNFSGFIYSEHGPPQSNDFNGDFVEIEKLRDHWYWAASM